MCIRIVFFCFCNNLDYVNELLTNLSASYFLFIQIHNVVTIYILHSNIVLLFKYPNYNKA